MGETSWGGSEIVGRSRRKRVYDVVYSQWKRGRRQISTCEAQRDASSFGRIPADDGELNMTIANRSGVARSHRPERPLHCRRDHRRVSTGCGHEGQVRLSENLNIRHDDRWARPARARPFQPPSHRDSRDRLGISTPMVILLAMRRGCLKMPPERSHERKCEDVRSPRRSSP